MFWGAWDYLELYWGCLGGVIEDDERRFQSWSQYQSITNSLMHILNHGKSKPIAIKHNVYIVCSPSSVCRQVCTPRSLSSLLNDLCTEFCGGVLGVFEAIRGVSGGQFGGVVCAFEKKKQQIPGTKRTPISSYFPIKSYSVISTWRTTEWPGCTWSAAPAWLDCLTRIFGIRWGGRGGPGWRWRGMWVGNTGVWPLDGNRALVQIQMSYGKK